jgi:tetratricopeptide (TPR) repeat protein
MKCPRCGADANGAFCSSCGAPLAQQSACSRCAAPLPEGARYCVQCGARAHAQGRWLRVAIPAALVALALIAGFWLGRGGSAPDSVPTTSVAAPAPALGSPPPLTGSMRDQADRLFERIMEARSRGDTAEARFFLPMALQAYAGAEPLDADGLFHLGLLQLEGDRAEEAARTAERIATLDSDHLFGFALAGEAALASGDQAAARTAFARLLERFDVELTRDLPEYRMHRPALDEYRTRAQQVTAG